ncbi:MAG: DUF1549 and DUF1553 domain-containing protein [Gemmataceae bacterium]
MVRPRPGLTFLVLCLSLIAAPAAEPVKKASDDLSSYDALIKSKDRKHWAFQPLRKLELPRVKNTAWVRNPIDQFVLAKLEEKSWKPNEPAQQRALLRRLYLDLTGLPPTPEEQGAFLKAPTPEAADRLIDNLLARPEYGERWGRHWLDLVRYAETNGYERDAHKPNIWRYRDYVIGAFNADKPHDRFILEQLAGDELPDSNAETVIATSYYRLGPWDDEPADPQEDRYDQLEDMINTTSQVYLGLTLACARCHNHKFEPLTMHDYYRLAAVFNTLQRPQDGRTELDRPAGTCAQLNVQRERDERILKLRLTTLAMAVSGSGGIPLGARHAAVETEVNKLRKATPDLPRGYFLVEASPKPPATHLLKRGKAANPGPEVGPGLPAVLVDRQPEFLTPDLRTSRRRLTLAQWIASPDNPLTARVIVNRVWQYHFGEGLVRTSSDFGAMGEAPTHPELLDWLANWFVKEGWSIKKLHRLILTSNTYRMSKKWNKEYGEEDPEIRLLWRVPNHRLEVEAIRDSMLAVSGQLNSKIGGPSMFPPIPKEALEGSSDPDKIWKASDEKEASRRTVYACVKRSMVVPMLEVLDFCDTARSAAKRNVTSVAPQALTLFNGEFVNRQAKRLAERLSNDAGNDPEKQIERAYTLTLCRPPSKTESERLSRFLREESGRMLKEAEDAKKPINEKTAQEAALVQMCRVVLNLSEFVYPD